MRRAGMILAAGAVGIAALGLVLDRPERGAAWIAPTLEWPGRAPTDPDSTRARRGERGASIASRSGPPRSRQEADDGPAYDGRFTFVRIRFETGGGGLRSFGFGGRREPPWHHDNPRAEQNFARILNATTFVDAYGEGAAGRILTLDDPDLFKYPIAYIVEVGYWQPDEVEIERLREYLLKGGFLIVDDFRGYAIRNFQIQMNRVLPGAQLKPVEHGHEVFDSFFHIEDPTALPSYSREPPMYLGYYEDDDPDKRLMVMVNYNQDIAEYWEYSDRGYYPIDLSNEAYKFGVNYVIYGMTH